MKKTICIILISFITIPTYAGIVRVFFKDDGKIAVLDPVKELHIPEYFEGTPYKDIDSSKLPIGENRNKWRWNLSDKLIYVDNTIITKIEKINGKESLLDEELAKPAPDPVKVIKLYRALELIKRENEE